MRYAGEVVPVGQVVFFRAVFAILPVVLVYAWRGELRDAVRTKRPLGHLGRGMFSIGGMFLNFAALARLPVVDATAFSFSSPLHHRGLFRDLSERARAALSLVGGDRRLFRRGRDAVAAFDLSIFSGATLSVARSAALFAIRAAVFNSGSVIQTRRLTDSETTRLDRVLFLADLRASRGLRPGRFGWIWPTPMQLAALIATGILGGIAHILLTESYRYGPASLVAPFGYTIMLWVFLLGYLMFGEIPHLLVFIGSVIVVGAGLFVIYRERQLGLKRPHEVEGQPGPG